MIILSIVVYITGIITCSMVLLFMMCDDDKPELFDYVMATVLSTMWWFILPVLGMVFIVKAIHKFITKGGFLFP